MNSIKREMYSGTDNSRVYLMNYYIFGSSKEVFTCKKSKALLKTTSLDNALMKFDKMMNEVAAKHLVLLMDLTPMSNPILKRKKYCNEEKLNFMIIAEWRLGDEFNIMKTIRSDYVKITTRSKEIEINSNKKVAEYIEKHISTRTYADIDIQLMSVMKYGRKAVINRKVLDISDYLANQKTPELDPFVKDNDIKYVIDMRKYATVEMPRRFRTFNMELNKFDQDVTDEEREEQMKRRVERRAEKEEEDKYSPEEKVAVI